MFWQVRGFRWDAVFHYVRFTECFIVSGDLSMQRISSVRHYAPELDSPG